MKPAIVLVLVALCAGCIPDVHEYPPNYTFGIRG